MKKFIASVAAAGLLSVGVVMAAAGTANAAGCSTWANKPTKNAQTASGKGGRQDCTSSVSWVNVRLVHYQPLFPHERKAEVTVSNVTNLTRTVSWTRPNSSTAVGWDWYTAAETSSGQKTESPLVRLWS